MAEWSNFLLTPYSDDYPTCERTDLTLRIYPGDLHPREVTRRLALEPSSEQVKGEVLPSVTGRNRVTRLNGWFLASEGKVLSLDLRRHLDWLLDILEPRAGELDALQRSPGVKMSVNCVWWSACGHGGPTLWPEQMRRLAALNLELGFDIYFFGEAEGGKPKTSPELWGREPRSRRPTN